MIEQLKTIRYLMDTYCPECHDGYAALAQLEAMAGSQEPVADINVRPSESGGTIASVFSHKLPVGSWLLYRAAPAAQQYEAGDMASAAAQGFRDGVASVAQQPSKATLEKLRAWETSGELIGRAWSVLQSQEKEIMRLEKMLAEERAQQPQAEVVPSDVVRDAAPIPAHELVTMYDERPTSDLEMIEFAREVERRHGIGVQPQHITDGSPCWCNPDVAYTDPETGASVIVHRRPQ